MSPLDYATQMEYTEALDIFNPDNKSVASRGMRDKLDEELKLLSNDKTKFKTADEKNIAIEAKEMLEAVSDNHLEEVKRLLKKNCAVNEPDYDGRTPLHIAASNDNKEIV